MPTDLPRRHMIRSSRDRTLLAFVFVFAFFGAIFAIEIIDPAPMDVNAGWVVSP